MKLVLCVAAAARLVTLLALDAAGVAGASPGGIRIARALLIRRCPVASVPIHSSQEEATHAHVHLVG